MSGEEAVKSESIVSRGTSYFRDSVEELKKVSTPTRQETIQATIVTIIIMSFVAVCLLILDYLLGNLMRVILG